MCATDVKNVVSGYGRWQYGLTCVATSLVTRVSVTMSANDNRVSMCASKTSGIVSPEKKISMVVRGIVLKEVRIK